MKKLFLLGLLTFLIGTGCGLNNIKKTYEFRPGMTSQQVVSILGTPKSTQFYQGYVVWRYSLHQYWVGWVPHYLAFRADKMTLVSWRSNMNEYYANQRLWLDSLPKQHILTHQGTIKYEGNVDVKHKGTIYHQVR